MTDLRIPDAVAGADFLVHAGELADAAAAAQYTKAIASIKDLYEHVPPVDFTDPKIKALLLTNVLALFLAARDGVAGGKLNAEMGQDAALALKALQAAGIDSSTLNLGTVDTAAFNAYLASPDGQALLGGTVTSIASLTLSNMPPVSGFDSTALQTWQQLATFGVTAGIDTAYSAIFHNRSLQSMIELEYVKQGNDILFGNFTSLRDALTTTQNVIALLTQLQNLRNNAIGTGTDQSALMTQGIQTLPAGQANGSGGAQTAWDAAYTAYADAILLGKGLPASGSTTYQLDPTVNLPDTNTLTNFINIVQGLPAKITTLNVAQGTGGQPGDPNYNLTLAGRLQTIHDDIIAAVGVTNSTDMSNTGPWAVGFGKWVLDNRNTMVATLGGYFVPPVALVTTVDTTPVNLLDIYNRASTTVTDFMNNGDFSSNFNTSGTPIFTSTATNDFAMPMLTLFANLKALQWVQGQIGTSTDVQTDISVIFTKLKDAGYDIKSTTTTDPTAQQVVDYLNNTAGAGALLGATLAQARGFNTISPSDLAAFSGGLPFTNSPVTNTFKFGPTLTQVIATQNGLLPPRTSSLQAVSLAAGEDTTPISLLNIYDKAAASIDSFLITPIDSTNTNALFQSDDAQPRYALFTNLKVLQYLNDLPEVSQATKDKITTLFGTLTAAGYDITDSHTNGPTGIGDPTASAVMAYVNAISTGSTGYPLGATVQQARAFTNGPAIQANYFPHTATDYYGTTYDAVADPFTGTSFNYGPTLAQIQTWQNNVGGVTNINGTTTTNLEIYNKAATTINSFIDTANSHGFTPANAPTDINWSRLALFMNLKALQYLKQQTTGVSTALKTDIQALFSSLSTINSYDYYGTEIPEGYGDANGGPTEGASAATVMSFMQTTQAGELLGKSITEIRSMSDLSTAGSYWQTTFRNGFPGANGNPFGGAGSLYGPSLQQLSDWPNSTTSTTGAVLAIVVDSISTTNYNLDLYNKAFNTINNFASGATQLASNIAFSSADYKLGRLTFYLNLKVLQYLQDPTTSGVSTTLRTNITALFTSLKDISYPQTDYYGNPTTPIGGYGTVNGPTEGPTAATIVHYLTHTVAGSLLGASIGDARILNDDPSFTAPLLTNFPGGNPLVGPGSSSIYGPSIDQLRSWPYSDNGFTALAASGSAAITPLTPTSPPVEAIYNAAVASVNDFFTTHLNSTTLNPPLNQTDEAQPRFALYCNLKTLQWIQQTNALPAAVTANITTLFNKLSAAGYNINDGRDAQSIVNYLTDGDKAIGGYPLGTTVAAARGTSPGTVENLGTPTSSFFPGGYPFTGTVSNVGPTIAQISLWQFQHGPLTTSLLPQILPSDEAIYNQASITINSFLGTPLNNNATDNVQPRFAFFVNLKVLQFLRDKVPAIDAVIKANINKLFQSIKDDSGYDITAITVPPTPTATQINNYLKDNVDKVPGDYPLGATATQARVFANFTNEQLALFPGGNPFTPATTGSFNFGPTIAQITAWQNKHTIPAGEAQKAGLDQQSVSAGVTAATNLNDTQKQSIQNAFFIFQQFYQSAASILTSLTQIIQKMGRDISGR